MLLTPEEFGQLKVDDTVEADGLFPPLSKETLVLKVAERTATEDRVRRHLFRRDARSMAGGKRPGRLSNGSSEEADRVRAVRHAGHQADL